MEENTIVAFSQRCTQKTKDLFLQIHMQFKAKNKTIKLQETLDTIIQAYASGEITQQSSNADTDLFGLKQKLSDLQTKYDLLLAENYKLNAENRAILDNNAAGINNLNTEIEEKNQEILVCKKTIQELEQNKGIQENCIFITPYIFEILKLVAERVNKNETKQFTPTELVESYIINYNVKIQTYFHGWYIKKQDVVNIKTTLENK